MGGAGGRQAAGTAGIGGGTCAAPAPLRQRHQQARLTLAGGDEGEAALHQASPRALQSQGGGKAAVGSGATSGDGGAKGGGRKDCGAGAAAAGRLQ